MKIQDIPQVGKLGLTVTWHGRNGQVRRILAIPKNPRTDRQLEVRDLLLQQARRFDALTDVQQNAWNVAAAGFHSTPSLGQSGPLTGLQLFVRVNCKLGLLGQDASCPDIASYLLGISLIVFEDIYHMFLRITRARARMTPCPTFYLPTTLATVLDSSRGTAIAP
jgi:hypothetical protein